MSYIGLPCPKCGHVRQAEDTGPDYECPACGVVYAKVFARHSVELPEPLPPKRRSYGWLIVTILVVGVPSTALGIKLWRAEQERQAAVASSRALEALATRWIDAMKIAGSSGRIALGGPVKDLQAIYREIESFQAPGCLLVPKTYLEEGSRQAVEGFLLFMSDRTSSGESISGIRLEVATKAAGLYREAKRDCDAELDGRKPEQKSAAKQSKVQTGIPHDRQQ